MNSSKYIFFFLFCFLAFGLMLQSCNDESFIEEGSADLDFSLDTLRFDTVFTELGSATRFFKVFNPHDQSIRISNLRLESGAQSFFRLNVDGVGGNDYQDVEILAKDSLWVFVEVTIDPDNPLSASPFIIEDKVLFSTNGNEQVVYLEAFGQNANYFPNRFFGGNDTLFTCNFDSIIFDDPKPYVFYGIIVVDRCTWVFPEGTQIYVHGGVGNNEDTGIYNDGLIVFLEEGRLKSRGTLNNPVIIQGDRLEEPFGEIAGQWGGIRFFNESYDNEINHTTIKNSIVGVRVDSSAFLQISNSRIMNTSSSGIIGVHGNITAQNTLVHSNGGNGVQLAWGGNYEFDYCTVASYGNQSEALRANNYLCTDPLCLGELLINRFEGRFSNCIFTGSGSDEILLEDGTFGNNPGVFDYNFNNCVVRVDEFLDTELFSNFFQFCDECYNVQFGDAVFLDTDESDYHLDTLSVAENKALPSLDFPLDIEENLRDANMPDAGCYEYQY